MYLNYCRGLRFEEAPDYMYLRQLFRILFRTLNHQYDYTFDWTLLKQKAAASASSSSTLPVAGESVCPLHMVVMIDGMLYVPAGHATGEDDQHGGGTDDRKRNPSKRR